MVIGLGNDWRGDDAAGLAVARRLRERVPAWVDVLEREGEPVGLLDAWAEAREVLVIDAVSSGAAPGTIHRIDAARKPLPAELSSASTHALGLADAIELARALGRLPPKLLVYGIEGKSFHAAGGLDADVERAVAELVAELSARTWRPARER
jgi:hydrogenase maturation protease